MATDDAAAGGDPEIVEEPVTALTSEDKQWAMFCHLSGILTSAVIGLPFLGPLIIWVLKKDKSKFIDFHGKEALNFQINMTIYLYISAVLICAVVGIVLLPLVGLYALIMAIVAGVKANSGEHYRYPATFRLIK